MELGLANVVMKAVQARRAGVATSMPCAGKYGDDASHSKAQVVVCFSAVQTSWLTLSSAICQY